MYCSRDSEANDMIHMGSDHRSVKAQFVITAPKKEVSQKTHIAWRKTKQQRAQRANSMKQRDPTKQTNSKFAMPESLTMSKQAEVVIDAEVAASLHWSEDANAAAAVKTRSGRLVVGSEAAHHSNDEANAALTEFERADGGLVVETAAARHSNEDTNPQLLKQSKLRAVSLR